MQEIIIIAAMAENRVIGKDNAMPWLIRGNLAHFKEMTMGCPCIMGRKTWESLPKKPLPGRLNIVISKTINSKDFTQRRKGAKNAGSNNFFSSSAPQRLCEKFFCSIPEAITFCKDYEKIFIIGGESIYTQALTIATKIDLTLIKGNYEGDTFFPPLDETWVETNTDNFEEFSIITYEKNDKEKI